MITDLNKKIRKFKQMINAADKIAIIGHVRPDGDCIGSVTGLYNYITENYKNKTVDIYTDEFAPSFNFLNGADKINHEMTGAKYDLAISSDVSSLDRLGAFQDIFQSAISTICIDHHVSNKGMGDFSIIDSDSSSACEVVCDLLDFDKVSKNTAECLYLGMVHDTGVFKYSNTSRKTMEYGGMLIEKGVDSTLIIDGTFYKKTYKQNLLMARSILNSQLHAGGQIISSIITRDLFKELKCNTLDTEGIVEQLRLTDGVEVAILAYHSNRKTFKFSMRSDKFVDVSKIATEFGGGGHVRAAGFESSEKTEKVIEKIIARVLEQMKTVE
jgi:Exopolyphosphatase-related proteins